MKTVIKDTKVYFNGMSQTILAGTEYKDDAAIVVAKPALFVEVEGEKAPVKAAPKKAPKKAEKKVEEPKEELLVEAPVAPLEVEVKEEIVEEKHAKKSRKKKGFFSSDED